MAQLVAIRLLTRGPNNNLPKGKVITVDAVRAQVLIDGGHAQAVEDGS